MYRKNKFYFLPAVVLFLFQGIIFPQKTVSYVSTADAFFNPERGFYTQFESQAEQQAVSLSSLLSLKTKGQSLILRMYYLKSFRNSELSVKQLNIISNDFSLIRLAGMKAVIRFAYSSNIGEADAPLNIVLRHIEQIKPILKENSDVILVMQTGFIGAWGEMHSSTNGLDSVKNMRTIISGILAALPADRMIQVRTPLQKKDVFNRITPLTLQEAFSLSEISRVGHHNDCFLASEDDWGTYVDTAAEKKYLNVECLYTPMGGETCNPCNFSECSNSKKEMERLHWSFLNTGYHPSVISGWKTNGCYDEINLRLGYRFELLKGTYTDSLKPGGTFSFNLSLRNTGYAPLFNPRDVELILENSSTRERYVVKLPEDPRFWKIKDTVSITYNLGVPLGIPEGEYKLKFNMPAPEKKIHDNKDYSIRFANKDVWEAAYGYNNLNASIIINKNNSGAVYSGNLIFSVLTPLGVKSENKKEDHSLLMIQNYPNPFNYSTKIYYNIDKTEDVQLKIYNSLGQLVSTLIDEPQQSGLHEVDFDASKLSSGVYFYSLNTKDQKKFGKMIYLK